MLRLFCCTIPFGTDSHFAQALVFVSRGLVAKNALHESVGRFFVALFQEGTIWCTVRDTRTGRRHASAVRNATVRRSFQCPDANILPGQIKNNMNIRICGRADTTLSTIIIGDGRAAEQIPHDAQGRFLMEDGTVFQAYYFNDDTISKW